MVPTSQEVGVAGVYDAVNEYLARHFVPAHAGEKLTVRGGIGDPETGEAIDISGRFVECAFWLYGIKKDYCYLRIILRMPDGSEVVVFTRTEDDLIWG
jgi:hypothetical protein